MQFKDLFLTKGLDKCKFDILSYTPKIIKVSKKDRFQAWIKYSHGLSIFNRQFVTNVQGLGKIDIALLKNESKYRKISEIDYTSDIKKLYDYDVILSQLWVFGCYEIIRTLSQLFGSNQNFNNLIKETKLVKSLFERLRIPLAKFEAQKDHKVIDYGFGIPVHSPKYGIGWVINDKLAISRNYLAFMFLGLLDFLQSNAKK
jgi:hypothetical protein